MVVPRLQWPQLPAWMSLTGSKKRALEEDDTQEEEEMEVAEKARRQVGDHQQKRKGGEEPAVKRSKPTPPCAQCRAGVPGHWGHLRQA